MRGGREHRRGAYAGRCERMSAMPGIEFEKRAIIIVIVVRGTLLSLRLLARPCIHDAIRSKKILWTIGLGRSSVIFMKM